MSVTERDHLASDDRHPLDQHARAVAAAGLHVETCRPASATDVEALASSWAKRLGIPRRRPAWLLQATKP